MSVNVRDVRLGDYDYVITCDYRDVNGKRCGKASTWVVRPLSPAFAAPEWGSCRIHLSAIVDHAQESVK